MAPKESSFRPFVVAFGGEDFFLDRDIEKALQAKRSVLRLDGEDGLTDEQLVTFCERYSETPHMIIVDNAHKVKGDKALRAFIEAKDIADTSLVLVVIIRSEKLPEIWSLASSKGKGVERKKPKPWETDSYTDFIRLEATRLRVVISGDVSALLLQYVGPDFYRLANELRKLAIYVGQAGTITKEHVSLVTTRTPKAEPYQVAEAVLAKDSRLAMNLFSVLYMNSGDDANIPVVRALMKQIEKTATIRSLLDRGVSEEDIAVLLGMKPWPFKNVAAPLARKHDLRALVRHMGRLCKLDADVKGPARSKRTLVELAILGIAE
jgi:DNA polymerase-3 subunit delta